MPMFDEETGRAMFEMPSGTTLFGGFNCLLTSDEKNEWTEAVKHYPEWTEHLEAERDAEVLRVRVAGGDRDAVGHLEVALVDMEDTKTAMYQRGKDWFAGLCERRRAGQMEKAKATYSKKES